MMEGMAIAGPTTTTAVTPARPRPPGTPVVQVWWARPSPVDSVAQWLDPDERERLGSLRRADDRARFATGRALLRLVASRFVDTSPDQVRVRVLCPLCGSDRHGRPVIVVADDRRPPQVSLAHAGDRVVVALAAGPVGIDVERVSAAPDAVADVAWSAAERAALAADPEGRSPEARARLWVRKEAVLKATGYGLSVPLATLTVTTGAGEARVLSWPGHEDWAGCLGLRDVDVGRGYAGGIAVRCDPGTVPEVLVERLSDAQLRRGRR
jgi:4'-phosphopantetheinyl transferase